MPKPIVYLAGPISGCNDEQRHAWRNDLKRGFGEEFEFVDPTDRMVSRTGSDFEVVQADADAIKAADAVLANMWRESIGTAFGVLHAHLSGKIVVVSDPNLIGSRMLAFYADGVERTIPAALHMIRTFLNAERQLVTVEKRDGRREPFDRAKLLKSVRSACLAGGQSDLVPARSIVSRTLAELFEGDPDERTVSTERVKEAVWGAIAELAADPIHDADFDAVRNAWECYRSGLPMERRPAAQPASFAPTIHAEPLEVALRAQGTHSTIWGHRGEISIGAKRIFDEMRKVDGITEIRLGPFTNTHAPPALPHVRIQASKTASVIEGKCFDKGRKGTLQTFQIRVADPAARDSILAAMRTHLVEKGYIRSTVFSAD